MAGAALESRIVFITGLAGLFASAGAMAMGEWISVQTSRELHERELAVEARQLKRFPQEASAELARLYEQHGLPADGARRLAESVITNLRTALGVMAREELGIDADQLGGLPYQAAGASAALFCVGAIVPIVPFAVMGGASALAASVIASALALFLLGALVTVSPAVRCSAQDSARWRSASARLPLPTRSDASSGSRCRIGSPVTPWMRTRRRACFGHHRCTANERLSRDPPVLRRIV